MTAVSSVGCVSSRRLCDSCGKEAHGGGAVRVTPKACTRQRPGSWTAVETGAMSRALEGTCSIAQCSAFLRSHVHMVSGWVVTVG